MVQGSWLRAALMAVTLFLSIASTASADRAFTARFTANDTGQITGIANSLMTCPSSASGCTAARSAAASTVGNTALDNNAYAMTYIDVDGDPSTFDSSNATLALPSGSTILFAGLYWGGDYSGTGSNAAPNSAARNVAKFKAPGASAYTSITASTLDDSTTNVGRYQAFADVTSLVSAAGNGTYWVGDVQAGKGADHYAGWSLIIAYKNAAEPARNLTIFDGLKTIATTAGPTDIPVSGFLTPPSGTVKTDIGFVTYEGDNGIVGDSAALNGTVLSDAQHPATNFFDSHISFDGVNFTAKTPNDANQQGFDMAFTNADGILANSATSATIRVTTSGDQYLPGVITFATEIYAPKITQSKAVTDDNGGLIEEGDTLTYTITGTNSGQDGTAGFTLRDPIPANTKYVAGSIKVGATSSTPGTTASDAAADDLAEYVAGSNQVVARLGTGASATAGGNVKPGASYSLQFKVKVNGPAVDSANSNFPLPDGTIIANTATATYTTQTTGTALTTASSVSATVSAPDLKLTKTRDTATPTAGSNSTYTLKVENVGSAKTQGQVTVSDPIPANTTFVSATGTGWTCSATTTITCTRSDALAAGAAYPTISVTIKLANNYSGTLTNTGTVSGGGDGNLANDTSQDQTPASASSDLALTKTASQSTINIGDNVTFTLTATNNGPSTATSVAISDPIPTGFEYVSSSAGCVYTPSSGTVGCTIGTLNPLASAVVTITVKAKTGAGATTQTNTATVSAQQTDNNQLNNSASANVAVTGADLLVTKTSATAEPIRTGDTVTYVVTVKNNGPSAATGVVLTDNLPSALTGVSTNKPGDCTISGGTITCAVGALASGASYSVTVTGTANAPSGDLLNRASALGNEPDPNLANNSAQVTKTSAPTADLNLAKSVDRTSAGTGEVVRFTLRVLNEGPNAAANAVITDPIPSGLQVGTLPSGCTLTSGNTVVTCTVASLASGASASFVIPFTVLTTAPAGTLVNTATVTSNTYDNDSSDNQAQAATVITKAADLVVTKSAAPSTATTGDTLTFTLSARNNGPDSAANVVLTDVLPTSVTFSAADSGCTYASATRTVTCAVSAIASGSTVARTVTTTVNANAGASIVNTASGSTDTPDPDTSNNTGSSTTPVVKKADVAITKTATPGPRAGGETLAYTLTATNNGPDTAHNVSVSDVLPTSVTFASASAGCTYTAATRTVVCAAGDLAVDGNATFTITTTVNGDAPATISNTATVSATETDPTPGNNSSTVSTTTTRKADLALTKSAPAGPLLTGDALAYTLSVRNNGVDTASGVSISDPLPTGVSFVSASSGCIYDSPSRTVTCTVATLANGATSAFTINTTVLTTAPATLTNTATATATTTDPNPANNTSTATTTTSKRADLQITKTAPAGPVGTGDALAYTLTVRNNGPDAATSVVVTDVLPAGVDHMSSPGCTYASGTRTVTCTVASLANGASQAFTINTTVNASSGGSIANTATVSSAVTDPTPGNNSSTANTATVKRANLKVTKTVTSSGPYGAGSTVAYAVTVTNGGPDTSNNVVIGDTLPAGLTFASATPGCTFAGGTVTCTVASLASGASVTRTITATVNADAPSSVANTATVNADTVDPDPTDNTSTATISTVKAADIAVTKTGPAGPLGTGDAVNYTLSAKNNGPDTAQGVVLTDVLPAGLSFVAAPGCTYDGTTKTVTCTIGSIAPGATVTRTVNATVTTAAGSSITNTASATATTPDPDTTNNSGSATTTVVKRADLQLTKTAPAGPVGTGDALAFTLTVKNNGPDTAGNVAVSDTLPSGVTFVGASSGCTESGGVVTCTVASLASGATATFTVNTTVKGSAGSTIANTATVTSDTNDPTPGNNTGSSSTSTVKRADLSISKAATAGPLGAGDTVTYTLTASNAGPDTATNVVVKDVLPTGVTFVSAPGCTYAAGTRTVTCTVATLANGATVSRTITATVAPDAASTVSNTATVSADTQDPNTANNSSTASTTTVKRADLTIEKSAPAGPIGAGSALAYTLVVTNNGPDSAIGVVVTDTLPAGVVFDSASGCSYDPGTRTVTCTVASLAPGAVATFTVNTRVADSPPASATNTATVTSNTPDPNTADNSDDATTAFAADADLNVTKTVDDATPNPGQAITYTLTVTNNGPAKATGVAVSDVLPTGVTFVSADAGCSITGVTVTCDGGDIANGASRSFAIHVTADPLDGTFDPNATHLITTTKVEQQIDLDPGQTRTATVSCPSGAVATDGSFRVDAVDQGTGTLSDVHAVENRQSGDGSWTTTLRNDATGRAQAKVFAVCIAVEGHSLVLSAPVTETQTLTAGIHTIDLPCGPGQHAIAPSFTFTGGDARVIRSEDGGTGWSFTIDVPTSTTATVSIRCLSDQVAPANGHTHALRFSHPQVTVSVPAGQVVEADVTCADDAKGIVATYDLAPGLVNLGNDPRPKTRAFKLYNPTGGALSATVDLLCLADRTGGEEGSSRHIDNTASVTSTAPDARTSDNSSTVGIDVQGPPVSPSPAPAPVAPVVAPAVAPKPATPTTTTRSAPRVTSSLLALSSTTGALSVPVSCSGTTCTGTAQVLAARTLKVGKRTYRKGATLGKATFSLKSAKGSVKVRLSKSIARALKRAGQRSVVVRLTSAGRTGAYAVKLK